MNRSRLSRMNRRATLALCTPCRGAKASNRESEYGHTYMHTEAHHDGTKRQVGACTPSYLGATHMMGGYIKIHALIHALIHTLIHTLIFDTLA